MIVSTVISRFFFAKSSETSVWGLGTTHSYHSSSAQLALHPLSSHSRRCGELQDFELKDLSFQTTQEPSWQG